MECRKLTAKLRNATPACFMVNDQEIYRYKNIVIPEEIKNLEFSIFRYDVLEDDGAIAFNIWFNNGVLSETWPTEREQKCLTIPETKPECKGIKKTIFPKFIEQLYNNVSIQEKNTTQYGAI